MGSFSIVSNVVSVAPLTDGPALAINARRQGWNRVRVPTHVGGTFRHSICQRIQTNGPCRGGVNRMHCVLFMAGDPLNSNIPLCQGLLDGSPEVLISTRDNVVA